jgi:hypothetical protein
MNTDHEHTESCTHETTEFHTGHPVNLTLPTPKDESVDVIHPTPSAADVARQNRNKRKRARQDAREMAHSKGERRAVKLGATPSQIESMRLLQKLVNTRSRSVRRQRADNTFRQLQQIEQLTAKAKQIRGQMNQALVIDDVQNVSMGTAVPATPSCEDCNTVVDHTVVDTAK